MNIGGFIYYVLLNDDAVRAKIGTRAYPIVVPAGVTQFPFCIYTQSSNAQKGTKDGNERIVTASISMAARTYKDAHDAIEPVLTAFLDDSAVIKGEEYGLYNPAFSSEVESYDMEGDLYVVTTNITYDYEE